MMRKKTQKVSLTGISDLLSIGLLIATLFGFLGRLSWFLDLFSHFRVQYMQLCLPIIGIYLWKRLNKRAVALIALAVVNYLFVLPYYFGQPDAPTSKPFRAMLMNIHAGNGNTELVLKVIKEADPDILLLEEITPKWAAELTVLTNVFEYRIAEPQQGCFGIMLLSKHPLKDSQVVDIGMTGLPSITTDVYLPPGKISIVGTHPLPPVGAEYSRRRNMQLQALPETVQQQNYPVLLIGDLNSTPWSPYFQALEKESGLKNSMKGFGFQPSWIGNSFLKIPIDHVLHSPEIMIHNRMVGPDVGSDHLPVIVDFTLN